jgi:hypothetical protein
MSVITELSAATRLRLARLLGMMGSEFDGEVLNAARMADRLLRENGCTWQDVIAAPVDPDVSRSSNADPLALFVSRKQACVFVRTSALTLTPWELDFLGNVSGLARLSTRQLNTLRKLVARAIASGGRP